MWIGISILIVLIFGLVIWFVSSSGSLEPLEDSRGVVTKSRESFEENCGYLVSVGLLRASDCINFLRFSDMLAQLEHRQFRGFYASHRQKSIVEDSLMSINMKNLVAPFDSNFSEGSLFEVYGKVSMLCVEVQKVETDLKLAKKYKVPYYVNFGGEVYWVLPN